MAASMKIMFNNYFCLTKSVNTFTRLSKRNLSEIAAQSTDDVPVVKYPPVKGRYPPGHWGDLPAKTAWDLYERGNELHEIKDVKARLESYAGSKEHYFIKMNAYDNKVPDTLLYKQYVTKTHIEKGVPAKLENNVSEKDFEYIKTRVEADIIQQNNQVFKNKLSLSDRAQEDMINRQLLKRIMCTMLNSLSFSHPYLLATQVDEDARMETFWWRMGNKTTEEKSGWYPKGCYYSLISLQYEDKAKLHIRTEKPTPLFVNEDDELCRKPSVEFPFSPFSYGQTLKWQRPITTCGHWIGDPCEFSHLSLYTMRGEYDKFVESFGTDAAQEMLFNMSFSSGFGACLAQAHNQGFHAHRDVTYPFTTQTVVYGGGFLYFGAYQLNTMQLWLNDEANPKGNVAWISGPHKLFSRVEDGTVKDYNVDTLRRLVQCFCLEPEDRGVELRPYAADRGPLETRLHINHKGEPLIERKKIGRYDYTPDPVYY